MRSIYTYITLLVCLTMVVTGCISSGHDREGAEESAYSVIGKATEEGFDQAALNELVADIERGEFPNTHAVLIEHDSRPIFEHYFDGSDERWDTSIDFRTMDADSLHDLRSISKSVTSLLLGMALGKDFERAVEKPLSEYLPDLHLEGPQGAITLHQALTMTAGLEWNEMTVPYAKRNDEFRLEKSSHPIAFVLSRPMASSPGITWNYNGGLSEVIATIIQNITGLPIDEYARIHLFQPLDIVDFEWVRSDTWKHANPSAAAGLRLTARDLAKIGSMVLHGGRWNGKQIVPEGWVERSGKRIVQENGDWSKNGTWGYGYQWWVGDLPSGIRVIAGVGNGDQRLFILPSEKLVVTIFAGEYDKSPGHSERILDRVLAARQQESNQPSD
jgi:CubicO group peptidase (beta-lactamase class C family)